MRLPGFTTFAIVIAITTEIAEITKVYPNDFSPTRPSLRTSPIPATPATSDENTSGTTVINSSLKKSCPIGLVMLSTTH